MPDFSVSIEYFTQEALQQKLAEAPLRYLDEKTMNEDEILFIQAMFDL